MPLLDHFRPPLSQRRHWDSFHGAWAEAIALHLNQDMLPERYYAEARVKLGGRVEIDVATFDEQPAGGQAGGVAVWAPPRATATVPLDFGALETFEVQIFTDQEGPQLVSAIELVSPANKDRPSSRHTFAIKCASYLQEDVSVSVIDVVTERGGNLHSELLKLMRVTDGVPVQEKDALYAAVYHPRPIRDGRELDIWVEKLALGSSLPTLPLWLGPDLALPLDLEQAYLAACTARRIG